MLLPWPSSARVFFFLIFFSLARPPAAKSVDVQTSVFECLHYWLRIRAFTHEQLLNSSLLTRVFELISVRRGPMRACRACALLLLTGAAQTPPLFAPCITALVDLLEFVNTDVQRNLPLLRYLVPRILQLQGLFGEHCRQGWNDECQQWATLFSELGRCVLPLFLEQSVDAMRICELIFQCADYPDRETSMRTFYFWYVTPSLCACGEL